MRLMLDRWETSARRSYDERGETRQADRAELLALLCRLGEPALLDRFISGIVTKQYDGSENAGCGTAGGSSRLVQARVADWTAGFIQCGGSLGRPPVLRRCGPDRICRRRIRPELRIWTFADDARCPGAAGYARIAHRVDSRRRLRRAARPLLRVPAPASRLGARVVLRGWTSGRCEAGDSIDQAEQ